MRPLARAYTRPQVWANELQEEHKVAKVIDHPSANKALEQFPRTVVSISDQVLHYDASSSKVRRERFAPFYHHPDLKYAVGVIPTRSGFHVTAGQNPFSPPTQGLHLGELMEKHGGGGHRAVAGANPDSLEAARELAAECAELLRAAVHPKS